MTSSRYQPDPDPDPDPGPDPTDTPTVRDDLASSDKNITCHRDVMPAAECDDAAREVEDAYNAIFEKCKIGGSGVTKTEPNDKIEQHENDVDLLNMILNVTSFEPTQTELTIVAAEAISSRLPQESRTVETADDVASPEIKLTKCRSGDSTDQEISVQRVEVSGPERWSDALQMSPPHTESDTEAVGACEPTSEMYYTASSEVSLVSDELAALLADDERREHGGAMQGGVVAGHVAAMRERFESMTRANTPCPDADFLTHSPDRLA